MIKFAAIVVMQRLITLTLIQFLFTPFLFAQENQLLNIKHYNSFDNQSVVNVRTIFKDKYSFIWIGSQDGLLRYDGIRSVMYSKNKSDVRHNILSNDVDAIVTVKNSEFIWVLSSYGGLVKIDLRTGIVVNSLVFANKNLPNKNFYFRGIEVVGHFFYITTEEGYLFKVNAFDDSWTYQKINLNEPTGNIEYFYKLDSCFVVFLSNNWIVLYNSDFSKVLDSKKTTYSVYTKSGTVINDTLFLGTNIGIHKVAINNNRKLFLDSLSQEIIKNKKVFSVSHFQNGILFNAEDNLYLFDNTLNKYKKLSSSLGFDKKKWLRNATAFLNNEDQLWVGNELGISIINLKSPFTPFFQDAYSNIRLSHCYSLTPLDDSTLLTATADGIFKINMNYPAIERIGENGYFLTVFKVGKNICASGLKGTFSIINGRLSKISQTYPALRVLDDDVLIEPAYYKDSLIVFASQVSKGVYFFDVAKNKLININLTSNPVKIENLNINKLFFDHLNRLWIIADNLISIYDFASHKISNHVLFNPATGEPLNIIKDICYIKNHYYLATYGMGIFKLNEHLKIEYSYTQKEGITNTNLYRIFPIAENQLLASSNYGLYTINLLTNSVKQYDEGDGLQSNFFEQYSGTFWNKNAYMGGIDGLTKINPASIKINLKPPQILLSEISVLTEETRHDSSDILIKKIEIPNNVLQLKLTFSAISWKRPGRTSFSYRIIEKGDNWIDNGSQNFITLISLSPGTYHLQVKAANEDGVWSEPKELILTFLPKWYQTWWFYLLIVLTIGAMLYALYRYRISQIKKQHQIRKNIATDLHDDLGSTLNSVKVFTNLAISGVKQEESLQQVKDNLTEATMSLRDMIWVLDDSLDTVDELITRLKQFAVPVATASRIETIIKADSEVNSRQLTKDEKRNLFLICKEAINNSIKYSGASQINVVITASGKKIEIVVADNGKGFNVEEVKKGYGLKNMQYRAGQIRFSVILTSVQNKGTQVIIRPI